MPSKQASPAKTGYLVLYNAVSAAAWSSVLYHTVAIATSQGPRYVHPGIGQWTKWTQTAAALEILHSLFGMPLLPPHRPREATPTRPAVVVMNHAVLTSTPPLPKALSAPPS